MSLFKGEFLRFFAFGFAAGAVLVFGTIDRQPPAQIAQSLMPAAHAAAAQ